MSARSWHRKASKPVSIWMWVFILIGLTHTLFPEPAWLLIHIFTLGIVANSIVLWSVNLTERFLQQRLPEEARPAQLRRTWVLNVGVVLVLVGQVLASWWEQHWLVTWVGGLLVAGAVLWHAVVLARLVRDAGPEKRHRPAAVGYVASAACLLVGVCFGASLSMGLPGTWQEQIRQAHLFTNVGGFVGLAAMSSLSVLFPTMWRINGMRDRTRAAIWGAVAGIACAVTGALLGISQVVAVGAFVYVGAWLWLFQGFVVNVIDVLRDPRDRITYPGLSVFVAMFWLIGAMLWYAVGLVRTVPEIPTLALLLGFVAPLLIGTMSYLLPTTMGGGPKAVRAGLLELSRGTYFRVVLYNLALAVWLLTEQSWLRVVMSLLVFAVLVAYLPLLRRAVKAQVAVLRGQREAPVAGAHVERPAGQSALALALVAAIVASFGGIA